jgi:hypothetical protein
MIDPEGVRRTTQEYDLKLVEDLRLYVIYREDYLRDSQIAYAKSGRDHIVEGYDLDWIVKQLLVQVPNNGADISIVTDLMNYFLREVELDIRFDQDCNVFVDGVEVIHTDAKEHFDAANAAHAETSESAMRYMAQRGGEMIINGFEPSIVKGIIAFDIVANLLDNALIAQYLNEYLGEHGSELRFDDYLDVIMMPN